jgi:hypothetical protein
MKHLVAYLLKLKMFQKYRRSVGLLTMLIGGAIDLLTRNDMMVSFPWLEGHSKEIMAVGTLVALIGSAYKDDPVVPVTKALVGVPETVVVTVPATAAPGTTVRVPELVSPPK